MKPVNNVNGNGNVVIPVNNGNGNNNNGNGNVNSNNANSNSNANNNVNDTVQISNEAKKVETAEKALKTQTKMRSLRNSRSSRTHSHSHNNGASRTNSYSQNNGSSRTASHSRNNGASRSHSYGQNNGASRSHSYGQNSGASRSHSYGQNSGASRSHSYGQNNSASRSHSYGQNSSASRHGQKVEKTNKQISATEKVNHKDHRLGAKRAGRVYDANMLKAKTEKLSMAFKGLSKLGVSSREISNVVQKVNRKMNKRLGNDLKQAYKDYKEKKINSSDYKSRIYGALINKVQGIASTLKNVYSQKTASRSDRYSRNSHALRNERYSRYNGASSGTNNGPIKQSSENKEGNVTASVPSESKVAKKEDAKPTTSSVEQALTKKDNDKTALAPRISIFAKKEDVKPTPIVKKEEPTITEKATAKNKEKSEKSKATVQKEEKTAMESKPVIVEKSEITEKKVNIAENVGKYITPTTEKTVENSALKTGKVKADDKKAARAEKMVDKKAARAEKMVDKKAARAEKKDDKGLAKAKKDMEKELETILNDILDIEKLAHGLEKKDELPGNADKVFEEVVGMFNDIDNMVNGLDQEVEDTDEKSGLGEFVSGLKEMFGSGNGVKANSFLKDLHKVADEHGASDVNKVGKATIQAETLSGLIKGGHADSNSGINRVGDGGEGSGNFTAVNFMADMSNKAESGLDSYKDAMEAREEAGFKANEAKEAKQAGVEAQLSEVA